MSRQGDAGGAGWMSPPGSWYREEARAKVNLRLCIFPPMPDGYHPLETIFCRIDLADGVRLRIHEGSGVRLSVTGAIAVPEGRGNLAVRAATEFLDRAAAHVGVEIELEKRIPAGAGLGGGSSDAAAVLRLLSAQLDLPGGEPELQRLAAGLGADVAFFMADTPFALAWGRGERLLTPNPPSRRPLLLLCPDVESPTAGAYAAWDEGGGGEATEPLTLTSADLTSWAGLRSLARNDFEPVIYARYPELRELRAALNSTAAEITLLAGSGSALFGVYGSARERDEAAASLRAKVAKERVRMISADGPV